MARIYNDLTELVGNTPLVRLTNFEKKNNLCCEIVAKVEYFNPLGSSKDRVALTMIDEGIKNKTINKDTILIEPTSGNTGIGLAFVAATKGMKLILTMPETMSAERIKMVRALGAEIVLTPGDTGMQGAISKANELKEELGNAVVLGQFINECNPLAHMLTTAPEIIRDTEGVLDIFVATAGTCGTVIGTGRALKKFNPDIKIVAVEPATSAVLSGKKPGGHKIQGIGAGFIPDIYDATVVDEVIGITDDEAYEYARQIAKDDAMFVGISSGAAICAAKKLAEREENKGKRIVVFLPDTGMRYLSTDLF
ncbi:MAG: cysteine synthase A [Clostridiales bacterium]|nr:cysteine synthase A [Clostridiales bacterium]